MSADGSRADVADRLVQHRDELERLATMEVPLSEDAQQALELAEEGASAQEGQS